MSNEEENLQREEERELQALLKREFPPLQNSELQRDLWPQMLRLFVYGTAILWFSAARFRKTLD